MHLLKKQDDDSASLLSIIFLILKTLLKLARIYFSSALKVMPECSRSQNFSSTCLTGRGHKKWWMVNFFDFPFFPLLNLGLIFRHFHGKFTAPWQNFAAVSRRTDVSQRDQVTVLSLSLNRWSVPKQKLSI